MNPTKTSNIAERVDKLEKLIRAHIKQARDVDWLDNPRLVKALDDIAVNEPSIRKI